MTKNLIVMSSSFVNETLERKVGAILPAFLPFKNKLVLEEIVSKSSRYSVRFITLPTDYVASKNEEEAISSLNFEVIRVPPSYTFSEALVHVANTLKLTADTLIICGDTIVDGNLIPQNSICISQTNTKANWTWFNNHVFTELTCPSNWVFNGAIQCSNFNQLRQASTHKTSALLNDLVKFGFRRFVDISWIDLGNTQTFTSAQKNNVISRSFNNIEIDGNLVKKSSSDAKKIIAEYTWYQQLPKPLKVYSATAHNLYFENGQACYTMDFVDGINLGIGYSRLKYPFSEWKNIVEKLFSYIEVCQECTNLRGLDVDGLHKIIYHELFPDRAWKRFDEYWENQERNSRFAQDVKNKHATALKKALSTINSDDYNDVSIFHGDLFFGNVIYQRETQSLTLIDPKGPLNGRLDNLGSLRYDIGKLAHSVLGKYDFVINGLYDIDLCVENFSNCQTLEGWFMESVFRKFGIGRDELLSLTALNFLTMLPLHSDSQRRQDTLLSIGFKLMELVR